MSRQGLAAVFELAPFIQLVGYRLDDFGAGWVETSLVVEDRHRQQHGVVHAGVLVTMADHTAGGAASTVVDDSHSVLTAELGAHLLRGAAGDRLRCRGEVVKAGRALVFTQADVHCDGIHVARLHATMAVVEGGLG